MIKAVLDTNVLVSSLLASGAPKAVVHAWLDKKYALITSDKLLLEFTTILGKSKFTKLIPEDETAFLVKILRTKAINIIPAAAIHACRDPKDNMIIETAVASKANVIVSGDQDLLELNPYSGIRILSPKEFLTFLARI